MRNDGQTDAPHPFPATVMFTKAQKRVVFLLHFERKMLRFIYVLLFTVNIVFIFIVAVTVAALLNLHCLLWH